MKRKNVKILSNVLILCIMIMFIPLGTLPVQAAEMSYDYVVTGGEGTYNVYRSEKDQNSFSSYLTGQPLNLAMSDITSAVGTGSTTIWFGEFMSGTTADTVTNKLQLGEDAFCLGTYDVSGGTYTLKGIFGGNSTGAAVTIINDASVIVDGARIENYDGMTLFNGGSGSIIVQPDSTVWSQGSHAIKNNSTGVVTINGGTITSSVYNDYNNMNIYNVSTGRVIINGGTIICGNGSAVYNKSTGDITVNGGDISGENVIYNNNSGEITINGGTLTGMSGSITHVIYNMSDGRIAITGGTLDAQGSGETICLKDGSRDLDVLTISGGTVKNTGSNCAINNEKPGDVNISGSNTVISSETNNAIFNVDSGNIVVSDGTITSVDQPAILNDSTGNVEISGGTITSTEDSAILNFSTGSVKISGGTLTGNYGVKNMLGGKIYLSSSPSISGNWEDIYTTIQGLVYANDDGTPYSGSVIGIRYKDLDAKGIVAVSGVSKDVNDNLFKCSSSHPGYFFILNNTQNALVTDKMEQVDFVVTGTLESCDLRCSDIGQDNFSIYKTGISINDVMNEIKAIVGSDTTTIWFGESMSGTSASTVSTEPFDFQDSKSFSFNSSGTYTINGNITNANRVFIIFGASVILENANLSGKHGIYNSGGGTVTIESGSTLTSTEYEAIENRSIDDIIINGGTITSQGEGYSAIKNLYTGDVKISGGTITASNDAYGIENKAEGMVNLSSTPTITGGKADLYSQYTGKIIANDGTQMTHYTGDEISVYIADSNVGEIAVSGLSNNEDKFSCANTGYLFELNGTNLVIDVVPSTEISSAGVTNITSPAAGATPQEYDELTAEEASYTITDLTWLNSDGSTSATLTEAGKFKANTVYKAQIELTSADAYKFQSEGLTPIVDAGTSSLGTVSGSDETGNKLTFIVTFNETEAKSVTAIEVKTQPTKLTYSERETLDFSGLVVTLTYNDGSTEDIALVDFAANSITASPADDTTLTVASHNAQAVTLTCNSHEAETNTLTVLDVTAPILTAGEVTRTSDTEGTVKFTSDEAGSYYYEVVADGAEEPVIDTSGAGTACTTAETTITNPTGLTAGAKDIYIKVKDGSGNVSTALKIDIASYIQSESDSNGGNSSSGSNSSETTTQPKQDSVIVIVNGKEQDAGKKSKTTEDDKSTVIVEVDNKAIENKIDEEIKNNTTGNENIIQVPVVDTVSEVVKVELTGDIVKKLEENNFDVSVKRDNVEYIIPAEEFTISKVAENLDVTETDLVDIKVEVNITKLDEKVIEKYKEVANGNGAELVFSPVSFEVVAKTTKADGTAGAVGISKFNNYVERVMEIPEGVAPSKITTGIVFNPDGTYSHVPTTVYQKDGKWYASVNSLTNSNYSVIWNPITVKSVENHWAKDAVNDMASRIIIFEPEKFDPNKAITRADFTEYIVRALGFYREGTMHENKFKDVTTTGDRTLAILIASEYGVVSGYPDGTFRPDALITREEAMTM